MVKSVKKAGIFSKSRGIYMYDTILNLGAVDRYTQKIRAVCLLALFSLFIIAPSSELEAQRRPQRKGSPEQIRPSVGLRAAYFSVTGELGEKLPSGIGLNIHYQHPLSAFFPKLPGYFPDAVQAMFNYESLSSEEDGENQGETFSYSLSRIGLEAGPVWSFLLAQSQYLSLGALFGFAQETVVTELMYDGVTAAEIKESGMVFSSHLVLNYEYHLSNYIFSGGLYTVYGADEELPLTGTGINIGFAYKF